MTDLIFAANWKMHHGPRGTRAFLETFLSSFQATPDRRVWFFPPSASITTAAQLVGGRDIQIGAQNVHWEPKGAFTGEMSVAIAKEAGATVVLIGHSERRHVFGETDEETGRKVRAVLDGDVIPVLCVGETLDERERGSTLDVVRRQLTVLIGIAREQLTRIVIAYEPVWAIGTGRNATPADAAEVHRGIRDWFSDHVAAPEAIAVLYGGSVKPSNTEELLAEREIDGVLVGGASLDPSSWQTIVRAGLD
jgi:triosephosphate isomerase (TIM)